MERIFKHLDTQLIHAGEPEPPVGVWPSSRCSVGQAEAVGIIAVLSYAVVIWSRLLFLREGGEV